MTNFGIIIAGAFIAVGLFEGLSRIAAAIAAPYLAYEEHMSNKNKKEED